MKKLNVKIIAEVGVNHDGSLSKAKKLFDPRLYSFDILLILIIKYLE